ncbi:MAG: hypothetical protein ABEJ85_05555 [Haloarculaceae archaeon]
MIGSVVPAASVVVLTLGLSLGADHLFDDVPKTPEERVLDAAEYERAFAEE